MRRIAIAIVLLLFAREAWAACTGCSGSSASIDANCTAAQVNTCIGAVSNGATITVGAGSGTWGSTVSVNKPITLQGGSDGTTTITLSPTGYVGAIQITPHATLNTRITGFSFTGGGYLIGVVDGDYTNTSRVRIDNLIINYSGNGFVRWSTTQPGLIDNCDISGPSSGNSETIHVWGDNEGSWERATDLGSDNQVVVENNIFRRSAATEWSALTSFEGARWTFRFNDLQHAYIDAHPSGHYAHDYGGRQWEIYGNKWDANIYAIADLKAGTGVIYENYSQYNKTVNLFAVAMVESDGTWGCCCKSNLNSTACTKRVGYGQNYTSEPVYHWSNTANFNVDSAFNDTDECAGTCGGSQGHEDGIRSGIEYINSVKSGYTALDCPHPLTGLTGSCSVASAYGRAGYNVDGGTAPVLLTPIDNATAGWPVDFHWTGVAGAIMYHIQVDNDQAFGSPEVDNDAVDPAAACSGTDCHYYVAYDDVLAVSTHYYWRVRAKQ